MLTRMNSALNRLRGKSPDSGVRSSISDDGTYPDFCRQAATDTKKFSKFRGSGGYTHILEHVSIEFGRAYFNILSPHSKLPASLRAAAANDLVGSPSTINVGEGIAISPTTLRYMKVADDLRKQFGDLKNARICEIGVGYGGLCRIVDSQFDIASYTLVDLRPVLQLADRYLSSFALKSRISYLTMNELGVEQFDLVISNYAFTELARPVQEMYFGKLLSNASAGYITYNEVSPVEFNSMLKDEICRRTGAKIFPEEPLTYPTNCILIWKRISP